MSGGRLGLGELQLVSHSEFLCPLNLVSKYFNALSIDHTTDV